MSPLDHVPYLETVSWVEALWVVAAASAFLRAHRVRSVWARVRGRLVAEDDAGARRLAGMMDWVCRTLVAVSALLALAAVPALTFPARASVRQGGWDAWGPIWAGLCFAAVNAAVLWLANYLAHQTAHIGRSGYSGPERRRRLDPSYRGPERRNGTLPADDAGAMP